MGVMAVMFLSYDYQLHLSIFVYVLVDVCCDWLKMPLFEQR